jgi:flagellar biosynthesis GTPase FlhF
MVYHGRVLSGLKQKEVAMEVGSVSSSLYSATLAASTQNTQAQSQSRARQSEQTAADQQAQQPQAAQQAVQTERTQAAQNAPESESTVSAQVEAERNRPTVNTNGQVVGTRINTTA